MALPPEFQLENEADRPMHFLTRATNPVTEMWRLMQAHRQQFKKTEEAVEKAIEEKDKLLLAIVQEVFNLRHFFNDVEGKMKQAEMGEELGGLDILIKRIEDLLENAEITLEDPIWKILDAPMREKVRVQSYIRRENISVERVIETRFPIVYRNGKLWKQGTVIAETPRE